MPLFHNILAACLIAVSGTSVLAVSGLAETRSPLMIAAGVGAFVAGLVCAPFFGEPGRKGLASALVGALLATVAGAAIAGLVLGLGRGDLLGLGLTFMAPALVLMMLVVAPPVLLVWIVTMTLTHFALWFLRQRSSTPGKTGCP